MRTVVRPEVGEAKALHARTRELRLRMDHRNLLIERHPAQGIVDTLLYRDVFIKILWQLLGKHRAE